MTCTLMWLGLTRSPAWHEYFPPSSALARWMMREETVVEDLLVITLTPPRVDV